MYSRQESLNLYIPQHVTVVGCGGIGSWVALDFALLGVPSLTLIDADRVEESNLNRTPFKESHIGKPKAQALAELVLERRFKTNLEVVCSRYTGGRLKDVIFDCRDNTSPLIEGATKLGYDGLSLTIDPNGGANTWNAGRGYQTVPSFVGTPQLIASLVVSAVAINATIDTTISIAEIIERMDKNVQPA